MKHLKKRTLCLALAGLMIMGISASAASLPAAEDSAQESQQEGTHEEQQTGSAAAIETETLLPSEEKIVPWLINLIPDVYDVFYRDVTMASRGMKQETAGVRIKAEQAFLSVLRVAAHMDPGADLSWLQGLEVLMRLGCPENDVPIMQSDFLVNDTPITFVQGYVSGSMFLWGLPELSAAVHYQNLDFPLQTILEILMKPGFELTEDNRYFYTQYDYQNLGYYTAASALSEAEILLPDPSEVRSLLDKLQFPENEIVQSDEDQEMLTAATAYELMQVHKTRIPFQAVINPGADLLDELADLPYLQTYIEKAAGSRTVEFATLDSGWDENTAALAAPIARTGLREAAAYLREMSAGYGNEGFLDIYTYRDMEGNIRGLKVQTAETVSEPVIEPESEPDVGMGTESAPDAEPGETVNTLLTVYYLDTELYPQAVEALSSENMQGITVVGLFNRATDTSEWGLYVDYLPYLFLETDGLSMTNGALSGRMLLKAGNGLMTDLGLHRDSRPVQNLLFAELDKAGRAEDGSFAGRIRLTPGQAIERELDIPHGLNLTLDAGEDVVTLGDVSAEYLTVAPEKEPEPVTADWGFSRTAGFYGDAGNRNRDDLNPLPVINRLLQAGMPESGLADLDLDFEDFRSAW